MFILTSIATNTLIDDNSCALCIWPWMHLERENISFMLFGLRRSWKLQWMAGVKSTIILRKLNRTCDFSGWSIVNIIQVFGNVGNINNSLALPKIKYIHLSSKVLVYEIWKYNIKVANVMLLIESWINT